MHSKSSFILYQIRRGASDMSYFVRVEVTLKDATYHVVISGTGQTPPPFKIENLSKVSCLF